jgi:hypothetical protein
MEMRDTTSGKGPKMPIEQKSVSFADIQAEAAKYVRPGITPLQDVGALYETRRPRL